MSTIMRATSLSVNSLRRPVRPPTGPPSVPKSALPPRMAPAYSGSGAIAAKGKPVAAPLTPPLKASSSMRNPLVNPERSMARAAMRTAGGASRFWATRLSVLSAPRVAGTDMVGTPRSSVAVRIYLAYCGGTLPVASNSSATAGRAARIAAAWVAGVFMAEPDPSGPAAISRAITDHLPAELPTF